MKLAILLAGLSLGLTAAGRPGQRPGLVDGIDLYGTSRIDVEELRERCGPAIEKYVAEVYSGAPDPEELFALYNEMTHALKKLGDFAYRDVAVIQYPGDEDSVYVTVDVVEHGDRERRMDFRPSPKGQLEDPGGLLMMWRSYETKAMTLAQRGVIDLETDPENCPALHCIVPFDHPDLAPFAESFNTLVPQHEDELIAVLLEERSERKRAAAAFLLGHARDPAVVVDALQPALDDKSPLVRNNALRVLAAIARGDAEVDVPLGPLIEALDDPQTEVRNKAAFVLTGIASRPEHREVLVREAGPILLRLLRLVQPNNHDPAYDVLKQVSGKELGARDYAAWEEWLEQARAGS